MNSAETQQATFQLLETRLRGNAPFEVLADELVTHLKEHYPNYHWVGIYMLEGENLKLWSWDGPAPTEHTDIPLHEGLCGWAASTGQIANIPDVTADDRYLQCFLGTRSELVVPIAKDGRVYGEIDIDSDTLAAFTPEDEHFLTQVCERLAEKAEAEGLQARALS